MCGLESVDSYGLRGAADQNLEGFMSWFEDSEGSLVRPLEGWMLWADAYKHVCAFHQGSSFG